MIAKKLPDNPKSLKENKHFTVFVTNVPKCNRLCALSAMIVKLAASSQGKISHKFSLSDI